LATRLGIDGSYVARLEVGSRHPSDHLLAQWVAVCPVPIYAASSLVPAVQRLTTVDVLMAQADIAERHHGVPVADVAQALHLPAAVALAAAPPDPSLAVGLAWVAFRVAQANSPGTLTRLVSALGGGESTAVQSAWSALLQAVAAAPVIPSATPLDLQWATAAALWDRLTPSQHRLVVVLMQELAQPQTN
jgi:hypothetical protein